MIRSAPRAGLGIGLVLAAACAGSGSSDSDVTASREPADTEVELAVGETASLPDAPLRITLLGVPTDSRCPVDVTCVWEGDVEVRLEVEPDDEPAREIAIHSTLEPREVVVDGFELSLVEVRPEPLSGSSIPPERYRVRIGVHVP